MNHDSNAIKTGDTNCLKQPTPQCSGKINLRTCYVSFGRSHHQQWAVITFQFPKHWLLIKNTSNEHKISSLARSQNLQRKPQSKPLSCTTWYFYRSYQRLNLLTTASLQGLHYFRQSSFPKHKMKEKKPKPGEINVLCLLDQDILHTGTHLKSYFNNVTNTAC